MIHCVYNNYGSKVEDFWYARLIRFVHHSWFVRAYVFLFHVRAPTLLFSAYLNCCAAGLIESSA
jgi:hypothetical protein